MKNHVNIDGKLYQTNKKYKDLKQKQQEKIAQWMYEAYVLQMEQKISDFEALDNVYDKIEDAEIWIPFEVEKKYRSKKNHFQKRYEKQIMQ